MSESAAMAMRFEVQRKDFRRYRLVEVTERPLEAGEIRLYIEFFAITANNLTYAAAGDTMGYWQFFPALALPDDRWGVIPVWGFAEVVESRDEEIAVGERLFGYFPPGEEVIIQPAKIKPGMLFDGSAHRAKLPPLYNRYMRVPARSADRLPQERARALFGPLYNTSFCLFDQLRKNAWYGVQQILIVSASSKTAIGLAYGLAQNDAAPAVVGLTSEANLDFVKTLGIYDRTVNYADLDSSEGIQSVPSVVVDMAGNNALVAALESRLGDNLRRYISVGLTHWDRNEGGLERKRSRHEMFFAPSYMLERSSELSPEEFARQAQEYVLAAIGFTLTWLELTLFDGLDAFADAYPALCAGRIAPAQGLICALRS